MKNRTVTIESLMKILDDEFERQDEHGSGLPRADGMNGGPSPCAYTPMCDEGYKGLDGMFNLKMVAEAILKGCE